MSRIGKKPIVIPEGITVEYQKRNLSVKGPKGTLTLDIHSEVELAIENGQIEVKKIGKTKKAPALWGLTRALVNNMIEGVKVGYEKKLDLQGVGYRMAVQGRKINMALGFSHPVVVEIPEGVEAKIGEEGFLVISGFDKQKVGQFAAEIRALKKVEPYKGKGFKYVGEQVRRKAGKKAAAK